MSLLTAHQLKLERTLDAPVDRVFAALTRKEAIARWFGPSDEFEVKVHEWDCHVGGRYRVEFVTPEGPHICHGQFKEIVPEKKVSYSWSWEGQEPLDTLVSFTVEAVGDKTALVLIHGGFPSEEVRGHHEQGWAGSMDRLLRYVG